MIDWDFLIGETALSTVLPDAYASYRKPLQGALGVFLNGLPQDRQAALLARQAGLPPNATASERLALLARGCPTLHKLGQSLARERRLSPEIRFHLQQLETLPPTVAPEVIESTLVRELGPLHRLGITLMPPALAEASVAVVVPFIAEGAGTRRGVPSCQGVFKVLKPGVVERLDQELELLDRVGSYLDRRSAELGIPQIEYRDTFEKVRDKLRHEIRLDLEQLHLAWAAGFYGGDRRIQIPALFDFCTPRVTAMERVYGRKVTDHGLKTYYRSVQLAELAIDAIIARPIFSPEPWGLFHADPHAGNMFFTDDGRLALLDWTLVGALGPGERTAVVQIMLNALSLQADPIVGILLDLDQSGRVDVPALRALVRRLVNRIRKGRFPGFTWFKDMMDAAVQTVGLSLSADLTLFRKTLHSLEAVTADISTGASRIDQVLLREFMFLFAKEWPARWMKPPDYRGFASRISNADIYKMILGLPGTAARFWTPALPTG